jgi:hypothetical protein
MPQSPDPSVDLSQPLFDQRNCLLRSWNSLEAWLLGPRYELTQRPDGRWVFQPSVPAQANASERPPWRELVIGPSGSTVATALLGLQGFLPDLPPRIRASASGFLLFFTVVGLFYGEQRSELLRIAQDRRRLDQQERSDAEALELRGSIEEGSRKSSRRAVFAGLAVLQALSNSSDPELGRAASYFASILKQEASDEIEQIAVDLEDGINRQFDQLQIEAAKRKTLQLFLGADFETGVELQQISGLPSEVLLDALAQLDGQGFISAVFNPLALDLGRYSIIRLTTAGRLLATQFEEGTD